MNKVIIDGRLTKDPAITYTQGNEPMAIARYTLAVDRRGKDKGADFISCVAFGRNAEFADKYLHKGTKIILSGHIQTGSYEGKNGKVYTTDVVVDEQEFAESKKIETQPTVEEAEGFMMIPDDADSEGLPWN